MIKKVKDIEDIKHRIHKDSLNDMQWITFNYREGKKRRSPFGIEWYDEAEKKFFWVVFHPNGYPVTGEIEQDVWKE